MNGRLSSATTDVHARLDLLPGDRPTGAASAAAARHRGAMTSSAASDVTATSSPPQPPPAPPPTHRGPQPISPPPPSPQISAAELLLLTEASVTHHGTFQCTLCRSARLRTGDGARVQQASRGGQKEVWGRMASVEYPRPWSSRRRRRRRRRGGEWGVGISLPSRLGERCKLRQPGTGRKNLSERLSLQRLLKINVVHSRPRVEENGFAQRVGSDPSRQPRQMQTAWVFFCSFCVGKLAK